LRTVALPFVAVSAEPAFADDDNAIDVPSSRSAVPSA
jgi:hypothetical protein